MERIITFRLPGLIAVGRGLTAQAGSYARQLGATHVLVATDKGLTASGAADKLRECLEQAGICVTFFAEVEPEPPFENVDAGVRIARSAGCDAVIGLGGGSCLDSAKGIALAADLGGSVRDYTSPDKITRKGLPTLLLPATAGTGSEVTGIAVFTDHGSGVKIGLASPHLVADIALIDPLLMASAPPKVTAYAGIDALVHAVEAYVSVNASPETDALALAAIRLIGANLRQAYTAGGDLDAREAMAHGSLLAGMAFANAGVAAVHALAYPLGARYAVPHGLCNGMLLPYVMEANWPSNIPKFAEIGRQLRPEAAGAPEELALAGIAAVKELANAIGIPEKLSAVGVSRDDLRPMAGAAVGITRLLCNNPKVLTQDDIETIYRRAWGEA